MENKSAMWKIIGASNHTDKERQEDDYYATDPVAIDKLLTVDKPNNRVWECACGGGHLSERLKELGHSVYATDIVNRGGLLRRRYRFPKRSACLGALSRYIRHLNKSAV